MYRAPLGKSAAVMTARTPGIAFAFATSRCVIWACGCGDRRIRPTRTPSIGRSPAYASVPDVRASQPIARTRCPTTVMFAECIAARLASMRDVVSRDETKVPSDLRRERAQPRQESRRGVDSRAQVAARAEGLHRHEQEVGEAGTHGRPRNVDSGRIVHDESMRAADRLWIAADRGAVLVQGLRKRIRRVHRRSVRRPHIAAPDIAMLGGEA